MKTYEEWRLTKEADEVFSNKHSQGTAQGLWDCAIKHNTPNNSLSFREEEKNNTDLHDRTEHELYMAELGWNAAFKAIKRLMP